MTKLRGASLRRTLGFALLPVALLFAAGAYAAGDEPEPFAESPPADEDAPSGRRYQDDGGGRDDGDPDFVEPNPDGCPLNDRELQLLV